MRNPDLVAPGVHVPSLRVPGSFIDQQYGDSAGVTDRLLRGSGTSQAAAVVSGAPEAMGYCHCSSCRSWSGGPVNAFSLWKPEAVKVTKGQENIARFNYLFCDYHVEALNTADTVHDKTTLLDPSLGGYLGGDFMWTIRPYEYK